MSARKFWRVLGFPIAAEDEVAFSRADVDALQRIGQLVRDGVLDEPTALSMTRAVGRSVDRLATWQVQLLAEYVTSLDPQGPGGCSRPRRSHCPRHR